MRGQAFVVWLAQGGGLGRLPRAPGTWGSLGGLAWAALLYSPRSLEWYAAGTVAGLLAALWICHEAEHALGEHDPPSVVLDEIAAVPVCFMLVLATRPALPPLETLAASPKAWAWTLVGFGLFRVLDASKPMLVDAAQSLPGGWGVVMDDVVAAIYTAVILQLIFLGLR